MTLAGIFKTIADAFHLAGGIGASAELSLGELFPGPGDLPPCEALYSPCCTLEAAPCLSSCSISSPTRPSR